MGFGGGIGRWNGYGEMVKRYASRIYAAVTLWRVERRLVAGVRFFLAVAVGEREVTVTPSEVSEIAKGVDLLPSPFTLVVVDAAMGAGEADAIVCLASPAPADTLSFSLSLSVSFSFPFCFFE